MNEHTTIFLDSTSKVTLFWYQKGGYTNSAVFINTDDETAKKRFEEKYNIDYRHPVFPVSRENVNWFKVNEEGKLLVNEELM